LSTLFFLLLSFHKNFNKQVFWRRVFDQSSKRLDALLPKTKNDINVRSLKKKTVYYFRQVPSRTCHVILKLTGIYAALM